MKPDCAAIYARDAETYDRLVSREDHQGRLLPALEAIRSLDGLDVVELGAGTGRLTRMVARRAGTVRALDASAAMLRVARRHLNADPPAAWSGPRRVLAVVDHRRLPLASASADLVLAGWTLCYLALDHPAGWTGQVDQALQEIDRVLRPGGTTVILETLGTGHETPHRPENLLHYYQYLDGAGFQSTWIRTDYRFRSPAEAGELTRFFFGDALADRVAAEGLVVVPECTGLWWREAGPSYKMIRPYQQPEGLTP